jgi:TolB-like protein
VLPFKVRGAHSDLQVLAEGLTEDIVTGLWRFSYLRVLTQDSIARQAGESADVRSGTARSAVAFYRAHGGHRDVRSGGVRQVV